MSRLMKGMYERCSFTKGLFELQKGQLRSSIGQLVHNGGWYNRSGEKLGWGDLAREDFIRICAGLEDNELFIILGEQDSFGNFVTEVGPVGALAKVKSDAENPGIDYVAEKCRYIIGKGILCFATNNPFAEKTTVRGGLPFVVLTRKEAKKILLGGRLRRFWRILLRLLKFFK